MKRNTWITIAASLGMLLTTCNDTFGQKANLFRRMFRPKPQTAPEFVTQPPTLPSQNAVSDRLAEVERNISGRVQQYANTARSLRNDMRTATRPTLNQTGNIYDRGIRDVNKYGKDAHVISDRLASEHSQLKKNGPLYQPYIRDEKVSDSEYVPTEPLEDYSGVHIPGLPPGAKIMSVKDRRVDGQFESEGPPRATQAPPTVDAYPAYPARTFDNDKPAYDKPAYDKPAYDKPAYDKPAYDKPARLPADLPSRSTPANSAALRAETEAAMAEIITNPQSAETTFIQVLSRVTESRDIEAGTNLYSESLQNAVSAMWEADEVYSILNSKGVEAAKQAAADYRTQVGQAIASGKLRPDDALETYMTYAQQSLVVAVGENATGSDALYGLARIYQTRQSSASPALSGPKMKTLLQAAVKVNHDNWQAQNELGISYARSQNWTKAEEALAESIRVHPRPEAWHNISEIYKRQGLTELAAKAESRSLALQNGHGNENGLRSAQPVVADNGQRPVHTNAPSRSVTLHSEAPMTAPTESKAIGSSVLPRRGTKLPQSHYATTQAGSTRVAPDRTEPVVASAHPKDTKPKKTGTIKDILSIFRSKPETKVARPQPKTLLR